MANPAATNGGVWDAAEGNCCLHLIAQAQQHWRCNHITLGPELAFALLTWMCTEIGAVLTYGTDTLQAPARVGG